MMQLTAIYKISSYFFLFLFLSKAENIEAKIGHETPGTDFISLVSGFTSSFADLSEAAYNNRLG